MLDDIPVASVTFIAGIVLIVIAYLSDDIDFMEAMLCLGLDGAGSFGIGYVRNQAGRGIRK
jgi:hypothetical protein